MFVKMFEEMSKALEKCLSLKCPQRLSVAQSFPDDRRLCGIYTVKV